MQRKIHIDDYLSIKRIVMISLAVTIAFYLLYTLTYFFGRPTMSDQDWAQEKPQTELQVGTETPSEVGLNPIPADDEKPSMPQDGKRSRKPSMLIILALNIPLTFILVFSVLLFNRKVMSKNYTLFRDELVFNVMGSIIIALVMSAMITILQTILWPNPPGPPRSLFHHISRGWLSDLPLVAIAMMACYLLRSLYQKRMTDVENETLRAESLRSRFETLKSQLDPHFLFNSLNTLQSLIDVDANDAEAYIQQLSSVLRYTLQNKEVVALSEELRCVDAYCKMMQMRYGDNLHFDVDVDPRYMDYLVLPLSVQGLIENAIKHNVISTRQPLTVRVSTDDKGQLTVSNAIQHKVTNEDGSGIGLANLVERYRLKWEENVEISDNGMFFSVTLPLKENK